MCKNDCSKADSGGRGISKQPQLRLYWKGRHGEGRAEKGNLSDEYSLVADNMPLTSVARSSHSGPAGVVGRVGNS